MTDADLRLLVTAGSGAAGKAAWVAMEYASGIPVGAAQWVLGTDQKHHRAGDPGA